MQGPAVSMKGGTARGSKAPTKRDTPIQAYSAVWDHRLAPVRMKAAMDSREGAASGRRPVERARVPFGAEAQHACRHRNPTRLARKAMRALR